MSLQLPFSSLTGIKYLPEILIGQNSKANAVSACLKLYSQIGVEIKKQNKFNNEKGQNNVNNENIARIAKLP